MPALYIVATPIGNLEDITLRALRVLREVKLIAAEDTRRTRQLLTTYDIKTPVTSYHEHNKLTKLDNILANLGEGDVALVSDAGMPGINDPGRELITACADRGIPVVPIPGASVVITAAAVSGLDTGRILYLGFLPNRAGARRRLLASVAGERATLIALESPRRLTEALGDALILLGDRRVAVCRELTKLHEEVFRGTINQAIAHFSEPRGECTLVIAGNTVAAGEPGITSEIEERLRAMRRSGMAAREAVASLAGETGVSRKELYRSWLKLS
jgi:16S rRNA (cytidine1402-2'-O)-methyltransferase